MFRDPVHGLIEFKGPDRPIADLLDTAVIQRLRRIKQMGFAWLVYLPWRGGFLLPSRAYSPRLR